MNIWQLFITFSKYSLLSFGGGYMLIPLLIADFVGDDKIFTMEQFGNMVSVQQLTPGPIGLNVATYVGYSNVSFCGALFATVGMVFPTLVISSMVVAGLDRWKEAPLVQSILKYTRLSSVSIIWYSVSIFLGMSVFTAPIPWRNILNLLMFQPFGSVDGFGVSWKNSLVFAVSFFLILKTKIPATYLILFSAVIGALLAFL